MVRFVYRSVFNYVQIKPKLVDQLLQLQPNYHFYSSRFKKHYNA